MQEQGIAVDEQRSQFRPDVCLPPPPLLTDVIIRTKIPSSDKQYDVADRYQSNFTTKPPTGRVQTQLPPLPPEYEAYAPQVFGTPMVTYHVCRICMRPRSDRYHQEHPIAPYSVPPPPGICRRCRITGTDESSEDVEVVKVEESGPVRLGLDCVLPREDVLTLDQVREEMRRDRLHERTRVLRRVRSSSRPREEKPKDVKVIYRYITPRGGPPVRDDEQSTEVSVEDLAALNEFNVQKDAAQSTEVVKLPKQPATLEQAAPIVQEKDQSTARSRPGYTESEIRRFARDEVVRYRQAERLLDSHPGPYAHGRLVPVKQQIQEADNTVSQTKHAPIEAAAQRQRTSKVAAQSKDERTARVATDQEVRHHRNDERDEIPIIATPISGPESKRDLLSEKDRSHVKSRTSSRRNVAIDESAHDVQPSASHSNSKGEAKHETTGKPGSKNLSNATEVDNKEQRTTTTREIVSEERAGPPSRSRSYRRDADLVSKKYVEEIREVEQNDVTAQARSRASAAARSRPMDNSNHRAAATPRKPSPIHVREDLDVIADADLITSRSTRTSERGKDTVNENRARHRHKATVVVPREESTSSSSDWTERGYWQDGSAVKTASRHSRIEPAPSTARSTQDLARRDQSTVTNSRSDKTTSRHLSAGESSARGSQQSKKTSSANDHAQEIRSERQVASIEARNSTRSGHVSGHSYHTPRRDSERLKRHFDRSSAEYEYEYRERSIQPADRPLGSQPFDDSPPLLVQESETLYTYKPAMSKESAMASSTSKKKPGLSAQPEIPGNSSLSQAPAGSKSSMRSAGASGSRARGRQYDDLNGEKSIQVRFANKVAFSPTPPASDDYPPSANGRKERSEARRSERRHTLVNLDEHMQPVEVDRRGRGSGRSGSDRVSQATSSHHGRSPAEDTDVPVNYSKDLSRAFSESPSREKFMLENGTSQEPRRRSPDRHRIDHVDRYGPYRKVVREDSMVAAYGSSSGAATGTMREV